MSGKTLAYCRLVTTKSSDATLPELSVLFGPLANLCLGFLESLGSWVVARWLWKMFCGDGVGFVGVAGSLLHVYVCVFGGGGRGDGNGHGVHVCMWGGMERNVCTCMLCVLQYSCYRSLCDDVMHYVMCCHMTQRCYAHTCHF